MKRALSFLILFLIVFLIAPIAFADITIVTDQSAYNLGNKIKASASILQDGNFDGLLKLTLLCESYKLQYFLTPISLEANFRTAADVPEVTITPSMLGNCTIAGGLMTNDNLIIEEKESGSFSITNQLKVLPVSREVASLPADYIQIAGVVNEASDANVLKASLKIAFGNASYKINAADGKFNLTLEIPKNIKSGKHAIEISASDPKGNAGFSLIELEITAVPSYIKTELSSSMLLPGSKIGIFASLYDQADELINDSLELELMSPDGSKVFRKSVQSGEKTEYEFSQYAEPGLYVLAAAYKNLLSQSLINVTAVREIKIKYENETVLIENIGNVPFEDELTFILESELKKYPITKNIKIEPGKILDIDLSKEVPLGIYDVILPVKEGLETIKEKVNETLQNFVESVQERIEDLPAEKKDVLAANVTIHDNRPAYRKLASGLSAISGSLVGADGVLAKNPLITPVLLVVILLLVVFRYGRKPIMRLVRGKKNDGDDEN